MKTNTPHTPASDSPAHTFFVMPASIRKHDVDPVRILDGDGDTLATVNAPSQTKWHDPQAVAARIVACVNACAGLSDPAAQIKALRDALAGLIADKYLSDPINADRMAPAREALANFSKGGAK